MGFLLGERWNENMGSIATDDEKYGAEIFLSF